MGFKKIQIATLRSHLDFIYPPQESSIIYYLCGFSSFAHYTFLSPYRIKLAKGPYRDSTGPFVLKTNILQQVDWLSGTYINTFK